MAAFPETEVPETTDRLFQEKEVEILSDDILVERCMQGDRKAFSKLAGKYQKSTFAVAYALMKNADDAEDVLQDAMIKAYKHIGSLKDTKKIGQWMRGIARQEACGRLRKQSRMKRLLSGLTKESKSSPPVSETSSSRNLYHKQLLEYCMEGLSEKAKEIVLLHYMNGLKCEEISNLTGIRIGSVKSHLHKARAKMLQKLAEIGVDSIDEI